MKVYSEKAFNPTMDKKPAEGEICSNKWNDTLYNFSIIIECVYMYRFAFQFFRTWIGREAFPQEFADTTKQT